MFSYTTLIILELLVIPSHLSLGVKINIVSEAGVASCWYHIYRSISYLQWGGANDANSCR